MSKRPNCVDCIYLMTAADDGQLYCGHIGELNLKMQRLSKQATYRAKDHYRYNDCIRYGWYKARPNPTWGISMKEVKHSENSSDRK